MCLVILIPSTLSFGWVRCLREAASTPRLDYPEDVMSSITKSTVAENALGPKYPPLSLRAQVWLEATESSSRIGPQHSAGSGRAPRRPLLNDVPTHTMLLSPSKRYPKTRPVTSYGGRRRVPWLFGCGAEVDCDIGSTEIVGGRGSSVAKRGWMR